MEGFVYGASSHFRQFMEQVESYATTDWPVLILGETGVGKELIAAYIHRLSSRAAKPLVTVNASAVPAGLFESELFGYEKGAFSGATASSRGLIRSASEGTLFLDEVGEIEMSLQAKCLRVLESREIRSIGATRSERINVRFIAATNVDLFRAVQRGTFRHDLLERLSVLRLEVPALRDRTEDIPLIASQVCQQFGFTIVEEALSHLMAYHWPGNVRQLRNVLLRAGATSRGVIRSVHIESLLHDECLRFPRIEEPTDISKLTLADIERQIIENKIRQCQGNKKQAAKELGIAKSTLHEKIRKYRDTSQALLA